MAEWMSFWNQETRARNAELAGDELGGIYVPYGLDKIARGDRVYCVGIDNGELLLISRVDVAREDFDVDPYHAKSVRITNAAGGFVPIAFERVVPRSVVDSITVIYADGSYHPIKRDERGRVDGHAYEGRSSIRELAGGADDLDAVLDL